MACTCGPGQQCQPLKPGCWGYQPAALKESEKAWLVYLAWLEVERCDAAIRQYAGAGISGTAHDTEHRKMREEAMKTVKELTHG